MRKLEGNKGALTDNIIYRETKHSPLFSSEASSEAGGELVCIVIVLSCLSLHLDENT